MAQELRSGRYVVVGVLGAGAQGKTLDAVDKREGRPVAIKRFDLSGAKAWKDVELAEREARVLAALDHPLLPKYVEHFEEDGVLYLVMEKIEGTPLSVLRKRGPLPAADVRRLLDDARTMLGYLHQRSPPVIHRDLKPGNVIRRPDGSFAFVDFGAVRDRMRPEGGSTVVGTFGYMAPEQFQGRAGPASDVYAIGATALALLTGREPEDLPHKGLAFDLDAALGKGADPALKRALATMLEPDPDRRAAAVPSLAAVRSAEKPRPSAPSAPRARDPREVARAAAREARDAAKEARRLAREAKYDARELRQQERAARRARRRGRPAPFPIRLLFVLGLAIAQVAVAVALRVVVPLVLTLLSVVFGEKLRLAARRVNDAGVRAGAAMARAHDAMHGVLDDPGPEQARAEDDERVRVNVRVRVGEEREEEEREWEGEREEQEEEEEERAQAKRRSR